MLVKSLSRECTSLAFVVGLATASAAGADELQDLKAQVDDLQKNAVTGGATKGSFKLPGSDTSVTLGGYAKLDLLFSDKSAGVGSTADQELEAVNIPVGPNAGANERNQVKLHARQSRLWAKTSTPTDYGQLTTYVEGDFFGAAGNESVSNSNGLRIRHAYGVLGNLLAGQTWTAFSDPDAYPETVDFGGPVGQIFARQAQIRWTQPFVGGQWVVALENPETVASQPNGTAFRADDDRLPDLTANVRFDTGWGRYTLAGIVRQIRVDSAADPASRSQKTAEAIGINAIVPFGKKDDLRAYAYVGNALGRYTVGFLSDGVLDTAGQIELPNQWLAAAAYRHFWTPRLRSSIAVSAVATAATGETTGAVNKNAQSGHLNLIWSPVDRTNFGIEYIYARRETRDGLSGKLNRIQTAAQYFF